jgi:DNA-binding response OmpR family regulator
MGSPRILVADDDAWILRMVTTVLEKRGYTVETAHDGEEAYIKALASPPDLLITDVMMPKMDGWTLIKALRSRHEFAFVPVIFLTALGSDDDRIRGFRLGADDYLPKPFRFEELDLRVTKTLKRSEMVEQMAREQIGAAPAASRTEPEVERSRAMGLAGSLHQVSLPALLTLLEMERKTGILIVRQAGDPVAIPSGQPGADDVGRIYLRGGKVVAARLDGKDQPVREECVFFMLEWSAGRFEFEATEIEVDDEIAQATSYLLMEAARRMDERNAG